MHLGGKGRDILIDPLISVLGQGVGANEPQSMWEKVASRAIKSRKQVRRQ